MLQEANLRQYLLELMHACVGGDLQPAKFAVGLRACGVPTDDKTPVLLTELLWCGAEHPYLRVRSCQPCHALIV